MCEKIENIDLVAQRKLLKDRGICVVIPTFNNVGTIIDVVNRSKKQCDDVIVVSDGANDGTLDKLKEIDSIEVVILDKNRGKGTALKYGFKKALEKGFSYAITIDADGQHFPEDIPNLLNANIEQPGAIIIGERKDLDKMERSAGSKFANKFSNFWFFVQTGRKLKDTQTGFRLYPLMKLKGLSLLTSRYEAELELLVFASWHGVKIFSTPVNVYYPPKAERVSHFRPAFDFTRISILNTVLCILALLYAVPLKMFRFFIKLGITMYGMSFFILSSLFVLTPIVMCIATFGKDKKKEQQIRLILHWFARFIMVWHGVPQVKFRSFNPTKESFETPAIIICNHQSHLDILALMSQMENVVFMTNNWVWNSPLFGYVIRKAGYILATNGVESAEQQIKSHLENGVNVVIFPEGTRSKDCSIMRFHSGAFHLAKSLNVDVISAILYGAGKVLPKNVNMIQSGVIELHFDARIKIDKSKTMRKVASEMRNYYQNRYSEISNMVERNV